MPKSEPRIPLVDLRVQHAEVAAEISAGIARACERGEFIGGSAVADFERRYATFCGTRECVGVGNGTDAIELTLRALGVGAGDEVILPANTFIATAMAVLRIGAAPVLVDCEPRHHGIDPAAVAARIGNRTRAIIPVHLFGQMASLEALGEMAARAGVPIVEDAAQAHGALRHGAQPGTLGVAATTSFYPSKNLGAYGDAGAVLTNDLELARRVRALGNYGRDGHHDHVEPGFNSRLDAIQAVVLGVKLGRLAAWNAARRAAAERYHELLGVLPEVTRPETAPGNAHVWHLYVVRVPRRDAIIQRLAELGIDAGIHYALPLHLTRALAMLGHRPGDFPVAERLASEILSLPLFPGITAEQQQRVVGALGLALRGE